MGEFSASYTQCFCKNWGDCQVKYIIGIWKPHMSCYLTPCNIDMQGAALGLRGCNHLVLGWANSPGTADLVISVCRSVPYMMFNRLAWTNLLYNLVVIHMFHGFICLYLSLSFWHLIFRTLANLYNYTCRCPTRQQNISKCCLPIPKYFIMQHAIGITKLEQQNNSTRPCR